MHNYRNIFTVGNIRHGFSMGRIVPIQSKTIRFYNHSRLAFNFLIVKRFYVSSYKKKKSGSDRVTQYVTWKTEFMWSPAEKCSTFLTILTNFSRWSLRHAQNIESMLQSVRIVRSGASRRVKYNPFVSFRPCKSNYTLKPTLNAFTIIRERWYCTTGRTIELCIQWYNLL